MPGAGYQVPGDTKSVSRLQGDASAGCRLWGADGLPGGLKQSAKLPKSNVLQLILANGSKISARPSSTEPKIKFYFSVNTTIRSAAEFDSIQVHGELR